MSDETDGESVRRALDEFLDRLARAVVAELKGSTPPPDPPAEARPAGPPPVPPPEGGEG
jgi:hypothetical protein